MTTVREILFSSKADDVTAVQKISARMPAGATPAGQLAGALLGKVSELLEFEVSAVLLEAFKTASALGVAARETHAEPGIVRRVHLALFAVPWEHEMELDIRVAGKNVKTVKVTLTLQLTVTALSATIQRGQMVKLDGGEYVVGAALSLHGIEFAARESRFSLPYEIKVGSGISLVRG
jgi:hypothetical protein